VWVDHQEKGQCHQKTDRIFPQKGKAKGVRPLKKVMIARRQGGGKKKVTFRNKFWWVSTGGLGNHTGGLKHKGKGDWRREGPNKKIKKKKPETPCLTSRGGTQEAQTEEKAAALP